mgnify:FL=1
MFRQKEDYAKINSLNIDPIDNYFECIALCDIKDGKCISKCVEILKDSQDSYINYLIDCVCQ